jgi:transcriptional regulator
MYLPEAFRETRVPVMHEFMRQHPLASVVAATRAGLVGNSLPLELAADAGPLGTLRGHVARANRTWRELNPEIDALVVFQGPHAYVTPSWYAAKGLDGKVVPTWNYAVVHAYGALHTVEDTNWLRALVTRLTERHESNRQQRWQVTDAPVDYLDAMLQAIVGIEIPIRRLEGKWKFSQNRSSADRQSVAAGLRATGEPLAAEVADAMVERMA